MRIRDLLRRPLVKVEKCVTLREVAKKLHEENVGLVVVVDENDNLVGVISERDIVRLVAQGVDLDKITAGEVATRPVVTVNVDSDISEAAKLMCSHGIRHVVVIDSSGKPVGVVSIRDLVDLENALKNIAELQVSATVETTPELKVTS